MRILKLLKNDNRSYHSVSCLPLSSRYSYPFGTEELDSVLITCWFQPVIDSLLLHIVPLGVIEHLSIDSVTHWLCFRNDFHMSKSCTSPPSILTIPSSLLPLAKHPITYTACLNPTSCTGFIIVVNLFSDTTRQHGTNVVGPKKELWKAYNTQKDFQIG